MSFLEDLKEWEEKEIEIMNILNNNWFNLIKNPNNKWMDCIIVEKWIEVKYDKMSSTTWNFYFEYNCNWIPSWVFKKEEINLEYWVHCTDTKAYIIVGWQLKKFIASIISWKKFEWIKLTNWWDGWRTKWVLVPIKYIEELSIATLDL
jgi:hypothetical protein